MRVPGLPLFLMFSKAFPIKFLAASLLACTLSVVALSQGLSPTGYKSQEVSETDGMPVLMKHLPEWEQRRANARMAASVAELRNVVGDRAVLNEVDFVPGTEAVTAPYDAGRLVIIEYASPAVSSEVAQKLDAAIAASGDGNTLHKRIGNYNVLMFDTRDRSAAEALMDQVKYEKNVQWLGENPWAVSAAERAFVTTTSDIFLSTVLVIVGGIVFSVIGGLLVGYVFFAMRDRRRAAYPTHTDGGGMTRLNLDGFTPEISADRLLGK